MRLCDRARLVLSANLMMKCNDSVEQNNENCISVFASLVRPESLLLLTYIPTLSPMHGARSLAHMVISTHFLQNITMEAADK